MFNARDENVADNLFSLDPELVLVSFSRDCNADVQFSVGRS